MCSLWCLHLCLQILKKDNQNQVKTSDFVLQLEKLIFEKDERECIFHFIDVDG